MDIFPCLIYKPSLNVELGDPINELHPRHYSNIIPSFLKKTPKTG